MQIQLINLQWRKSFDSQVREIFYACYDNNKKKNNNNIDLFALWKHLVYISGYPINEKNQKQFLSV